MNTDTSRPANPASAVIRVARAQRVDYSEPAPAADVMFDQLRYLVAHARQVCPAECPDCSRLKQVEVCLLLPFSRTA